jgi:uncharacterized protein YbgA (DUF1722 family)/uncharacterized protein YbbK (DUF523 family)
MAVPAAGGVKVEDALPVRVGVSACLIGAAVRFDGGHKRDDFLTDALGKFVEFVPICPEVEIGLGVPRPTLRLVRENGETRLLTKDTGVDHTEVMLGFAARRAEGLACEDLSGYVLKKDSPSCGMERVRVYGADGLASRTGRGLFARVLLERYPNLPVEEEGRLKDFRLRENFIERVFAYRRLSVFFRSRWTYGGLVAFHTAHKLQLMAHAPAACSELGAMVAGARTLAREEMRERYENAFMRALRIPATRARHVNVLQHALGYFRDRIGRASRDELLGLIEDYRHGLVPLVVPITLVRHYVRLYDIGYLKGQYYLEPHPKELMLRNHV